MRAWHYGATLPGPKRLSALVMSVGCGPHPSHAVKVDKVGRGSEVKKKARCSESAREYGPSYIDVTVSRVSRVIADDLRLNFVYF